MFIRIKHFRVESRYDVYNKHWYKGKTRAFAFGTSKSINKVDIPRIIKDWLATIRKHNLGPTETERYIILYAYDARMEKKLFSDFSGLQMIGTDLMILCAFGIFSV